MLPRHEWRQQSFFIELASFSALTTRLFFQIGDWTTIGVVYHKNSATSKNGNVYTKWRMTDLIGEINSVSVMLFGKAQSKYYALPENKVVGLLNPKV